MHAAIVLASQQRSVNTICCGQNHTLFLTLKSVKHGQNVVYALNAQKLKNAEKLNADDTVQFSSSLNVMIALIVGASQFLIQ
jgi:alpha-tubulin suppressor-like RCC1 family protein